MVDDAERDGPQFAHHNDDRITGTGRIMRKYRIDEVPQLINVLKGQMSLVGPCAERPELAPSIQKKIPGQKRLSASMATNIMSLLIKPST